MGAGGKFYLLATTLGSSRAGAFSAANASGQTLLGWGCPPEPRAAMTIHSVDDEFLPIADGYGLDASLFWATCNQCTAGPVEGDGPCMTFTGCAAQTLYCETTGPHEAWTGLTVEIVDFFSVPVPPIVFSRTAHRDHHRNGIENRSEATLG